MKSDVASLAPPPPGSTLPPAPLSGAHPLSDLRSRSVAELTVDLEDTLRRGKGSVPLSPAGDGTPAVPSLIAVWLLSEAGKALGIMRPVNLSTVTDRDDLRSVGGVARLLHAFLHPAPAVAS